jgi:hypothetical protein
LIEESKTNSIRNNTMVGAVVGTPGTAPTNWSALSSATGISRYISEIGIEDGIYYVDIFCFGTATSNGTIQINFESPTGISALTGQNWTASLYTRLITGTILRPFRYLWLERNSEGSTITSAAAPPYQPTNIPLKFQRYVTSRTLSGGTDVAFVTARIDISVNTGDEVYFTIRIGMPQLEQGAFATSVIPTTTSTRTRAADNASITGKNFSEWYRQDEGTVFVSHKALEGLKNRVASSIIYNISTGPTFLSFFYNTNSDRSDIFVFGREYGDLVRFQQNQPTRNKVIFAYDAPSSDYSPYIDGAKITNITTTKLYKPSNYDTLTLAPTPSKLNGTISRLTYFPKRLPNEQLRALTR